MSTLTVDEDAEMCVTLDDIKEAKERISSHIHVTPLLSSEAINSLTGLDLFFKCENFQKIGAFKFRGATNCVLQLDAETAKKGVCTHSSGNHAQALALAAKRRGIPAYIVMPKNSAVCKMRAVEHTYNAKLIRCDNTLASRDTTAAKVVEETGAHFVHPYDRPSIIAGQGTCGLELVDQVRSQLGLREDQPDLTATPLFDAIIVPIGGGGLMSGVAIAVSSLVPGATIIGAEPTGADDAFQSFKAGHFVPQTNPQTICDGLRTSMGKHTWPIIKKHVERVITVDDVQTKAAMRLVWERLKIIIEPSSATALAVAMTDEFKALGHKRVVCVFTGGNVDLDTWSWEA
eukprot:TRINITY_DN1438_c1_g4_i1.p1 TRINITY_DN1438_c1_g4~~TRINITY_DN1438_c1_g4_i1.p1  ORF type:complete len:356 (+),score=71.81 TRINITY_DN1438_c1_g4_i1:35-1069(+)